MLYQGIRNLLFLFPPEDVHYFSMNVLHDAASVKPLKQLLGSVFSFEDKRLHRRVFGLNFKNPVGLAAGFDKNALYIDELKMLGFGFAEIGTVTPLPQQGNDKPRLFRLPKDKAIINRMGFNNDGVYKVAARLYNRRNKVGEEDFIVGGNIGKNKVTANEDAWKDYAKCFSELFDVVDYFVVNVSSPNTPGLRELQEKDSLRKILAHLQTLNAAKTQRKPLLLKIAPDLTTFQLDDIISLAQEVKLDGLVAANTTISRDSLATSIDTIKEIGNGGLSGKPLKNKATEIVRYLNKNLDNSIPVIASGGIFTGTDALEKLEAGAQLIQVWTGFIYEGPAIAKNINRHLANLL